MSSIRTKSMLGYISNMCRMPGDLPALFHFRWPVHDEWRGHTSLINLRFIITEGRIGNACPSGTDAGMHHLRARKRLLVNRKSHRLTVARAACPIESRTITRRPFRTCTIVGKEEDDGIVKLTFFFQFLYELAPRGFSCSNWRSNLTGKSKTTIGKDKRPE